MGDTGHWRHHRVAQQRSAQLGLCPFPLHQRCIFPSKQGASSGGQDHCVLARAVSSTVPSCSSATLHPSLLMQGVLVLPPETQTDHSQQCCTPGNFTPKCGHWPWLPQPVTLTLQALHNHTTVQLGKSSEIIECNH